MKSLLAIVALALLASALFLLRGRNDPDARGEEGGDATGAPADSAKAVLGGEGTAESSALLVVRVVAREDGAPVAEAHVQASYRVIHFTRGTEELVPVGEEPLRTDAAGLATCEVPAGRELVVEAWREGGRESLEIYPLAADVRHEVTVVVGSTEPAQKPPASPSTVR